MPVDERVVVRVPLQSTAYAIPAGHRIRLAVSNAYWPMAWPSPEPSTLTVVCGPQSVLSLPRRRPSELDARLPSFEAPETGTPLATEKTMQRDGGRRVRRDLSSGEIEVGFDWHGSRTRILATDTEMGEENVTRYRIIEGEPLSATVICEVEVSLARPGWGQMPHPGDQHDDLRRRAIHRHLDDRRLPRWRPDPRPQIHASISPGRRLMAVGEPETQTPGRATVPWSWYSDPSILDRRDGADLPLLMAVRRPSRRAAGPRELFRIGHLARSRS